MKKAIVVGSGAGGATAAKELQGHYDVTVLEAGKEFQPFGMDLEGLEKLRGLGLFFDEREIQFVIPTFKIRRAADNLIPFPLKSSNGNGMIPFPLKSSNGNGMIPFPLKSSNGNGMIPFPLKSSNGNGMIPFPLKSSNGNGMILVNGIGLGGTTPICTGNALRMDRDLKSLGIDLDAEFDEIYREIPVTTAHQKKWHKVTRRLFAAFQELGLDPQPMPKMGDYEHCLHCGRCELGCPNGIKWDSRRYLQAAQEKGAQVVTGCRVESVVIEGGRATGVRAQNGWSHHFFPADLVVLAAGGLETPVILDRSGIPCEPRLFVDPVLCVAARSPQSMQHKDITMPFVSVQEHIILSPYFDHLSFFFNPDWRHPAGDIVSIMIKLADDELGSITSQGIDKRLTDQDRRRLDEGVATCEEILRRFGAGDDEMFLGTVIAGHPGGMLPLTAREASSFHSDRLPDNLYVADASLLPKSLGNPPILTIIAMAKRISKICRSM